MYKLLRQRLQRLQDSGAAKILGEGLVGLERETLRITPKGEIACTPHPQILGAALTHPHITTDYSEALMEFITPPQQDKEAVKNFLLDTQRFVYSHLEGEYLWSASMPGVLAGDESVPIATYGHSNAGLMKTIYRRGLGLRYGRAMQAIAGVHFNYSLPIDYWPIFQELEGSELELSMLTSVSYMGMIRNLQRYGWIVPYLFGSSPAVSQSFIGSRPTDLKLFTKDSLYYPHATSLRMGNIGYQNSLEEGKGFRANYDSLNSYIRSLSWATETPCPDYEKIGVIVNGEYQQLSVCVLQIENEHYSTIRPKQILEWLEKPSLALRRRGIRYVELRSSDINIFEPTGVTVEQMYFLELLLLFCLLIDSPRITVSEAKEINLNQISVAHHGRDPKLRLHRHEQSLTLRTWSQELLEEMLPLATLLDKERPTLPYTHALKLALELIGYPDATPSARMLREMRANNEGFLEFALHLSWEHRVHLLALGPLPIEQQSYFQQLAQLSHERQRVIEATDDKPFNQFLVEYFTQPQA